MEPIVALYAPNVLFSSQPFRPPHRGREGVREYVAGAFADEAAAHVTMSQPIVDGSSASVTWWATLLEAGTEITLAGTSTLHFDDEGLVVSQYDTWNQADGRRDLPELLRHQPGPP